MKRLSVLSFVILLSLSSLLFAQDVTVEQMEICTAVEERQPMGSDSVFTSDVGQLYCFTKLTSSQDTTEISHVWFHEDKEMAKVELTMKAKAWRTWSSKKVVPEWTGKWRVEVQRADGTIVTEKTFTVN